MKVSIISINKEKLPQPVIPLGVAYVAACTREAGHDTHILDLCFVEDIKEAITKHLDEFNRRARKGKCFNQPYLGCREYPAHFRLLESDEPLPASHLRGTQDLGYMLHDIDFENDMQPRFFRAKMTDGVITIPSFKAEGVKT